MSSSEVRRNAGAKAGDKLILTKPIGVGIYSAAFGSRPYRQDNMRIVDTTTRLNRIGKTLGKQAAVHATTDVTGFGILGHSVEMARHRVWCSSFTKGRIRT
jgi:selenide, water dikinase